MVKPSKDPRRSVGMKAVGAAKRPNDARATKPKKAMPFKKERHLPAAERAQEMLDAAIELFADKGPAITVQGLADRVNVTQPLVHRYFPTKADFIAAIRKTLQNAHWDPAWRAILVDRSRALDERIVNFYGQYLPHIYRRTWYRGFWFFSLIDPDLAQVYHQRLTKDVLLTIIDEARNTFGYPPLSTIGPHGRQIELGRHYSIGFSTIMVRRWSRMRRLTASQ